MTVLRIYDVLPNRVVSIFLPLLLVAGGLTIQPASAVSWGAPASHILHSVDQSDELDAVTFKSDFNGDGYHDLAIGVPGEDVGSISGAGAVNVIYGAAGGLSVTGDQFWHQDSANVGDLAETNDQFGSDLAAGDFNHDGYSDLAIGVQLEDVGTTFDAGAVNVLYGSAGGLQTTSPADQYWNQNSTNVDDTAEQDDIFGSALTTGDFNLDTYADLAIGVYNETLGSIGDAGAVHVLYGGASGLQTTAPADQFWTQDSPGVGEVAEAGDSFGYSVAAGDFDKDLFSDLAIGATAEDRGSVLDAGAVNILYGGAGGLQTSGQQVWAQDVSGVEDSVEQADLFGWALAVGDFNGGGYHDLAIGVPGEGISTFSTVGAVNVLYGGVNGLQVSSPLDQFWNQDLANVEGDIQPDEYFGFSLAARTFDGGVYDDLAIGAPGDVFTYFVAVHAGGVNVIYGSPNGLQLSSPTDDLWNQDNLGIGEVPEDLDNFGVAVVANKFGSDGYRDLAIGVNLESYVVLQDGQVNVIYGGSGGLQTSSPASQLWSQDDPSGVEDSAENFDFFGGAVG